MQAALRFSPAAVGARCKPDFGIGAEAASAAAAAASSRCGVRVVEEAVAAIVEADCFCVMRIYAYIIIMFN